MKKIKLVLFFLLWTTIYGLWTISYAQEQIQILTYYPSPNVVYRTMRIGQTGHLLQFDYDSGTSRYRIYSTGPDTDFLLIGHTPSSDDIFIDGSGKIVMGSPLSVYHAGGTIPDLFVGGKDTPYEGRVGIGTTSPQDVLDVNGSIRIPGGLSYNINNIGVLYLSITSSSNRIALNNVSSMSIDISQGGVSRINVGTNGNVGIGYTDSSTRLSVSGTLTVKDNVGIGTAAPVEKLEVSNGIRIGGTIQDSPPPAEGTIYYDKTYVPNGDFIGITPSGPLPLIGGAGMNIGVTRIIPGSPNIVLSPSGGTGNVTVSRTLPPSGIIGAGNAGYILKYTGNTTVGNSEIFQFEDQYGRTRIGIGTTSPEAKLHVKTNSVKRAIYGINNTSDGVAVYGVGPSSNESYGLKGEATAQGGIGVWGTGGSCGVEGHGNLSDPSSTWAGYFIGRLYAGNTLPAVPPPPIVGIGIDPPTATLHVNGNIKANLIFVPDIYPNYKKMRYESSELKYYGSDIAELFDTNNEVEPCDVLVIDSDGKLKKSDKPYDTKIAGIVSSAPAIIFEGSELQIAPKPFNFQKGTKPPVALAGRVLTNVSAENGPVEPGDLLTTSSTPGHAMKAKPIGEINGYPIYPQGCIIGTALEQLEEGKGKILVLVF